MKDAKRQRTLSQSFTRRDFLSTGLKAGAAAFTTGLLPKRKVDANCQYNVLFIIADDLRPLLGCYGYPEMHTPNIDRLAQRGTLFNRAYCQYSVCNPSRTSILTGLRPDTTRVFSNKVEFRKTLPDAVTLPQHFKAFGYHTQSIGKVAHNLEMQDDTYSWSSPSWGLPITNQGRSHPSWQALDVEDDELSSGKTAKRATKVLNEIQNTQFFLALGFHTPHLPYYAPKGYYKLYKDENFSLPSTAISPNSNMRLYRDIRDTGNLSDAKALELVRAYAASISYMDAQVGRVLNHLDALRLTENTVIVFAGDHGYHLGEHGEWGKNTLFEVSLRSPLIVSVPGQTHIGVKADALVELVDLYPTLSDACQIPIPPQLEGISLMPLIKQPTRPWKTAAFSQKVPGNSIRTDRYRYIEWGRNRSRGVELYDYDVDPHETINIANLPENAQLVNHLSEQLHAGWEEALPDISEQISVSQPLPWDINNDGVVNMQDLVLISNSFGLTSPEHPKADVNKDGSVDIIDLLLVAAHFGECVNPRAPAARVKIFPEYLSQLEEWLAEARLADDGSDVFRQGIATLERLIRTTLPRETTLLSNYPNPFNPETWIPYDLAEDADVHVDIYNLRGESVRRLSLGFQTAGTYRTSSRAAYWDGRNAVGEPVASGIYFYTLQAGQFSATRQMVILK